MKKAMGVQLFCVLWLLTANFAKAQDETTATEAPILELKDVEQPPEFPGGTDRFYDYFNSQFKKPEVPDLIGKVFISFIVEPDGTLTDVSVYRDIGFGVGEQAQKIVEQSPRWIAGRKEGKRVRVHYILPIGIYIGKHD
jgi:protein TonB